MTKESRTLNSIKNISFGIGGQLISTILSFISRTIFIKILGIEYLGVNGLFGNILSMLSLTELGISNAIVFSMYKPLAEKDKSKLKGLMKLYRQAYIIIGIVVFLIGISLVPFLDYIIKDKPDIQNLTLIYLMFLFNSVITYFFAYKRSIIIADQKEYIVTLYYYICNFLQVVVQMLILIITKSFLLYLLIQIIFNILSNLLIAKKANEIYPYLVDIKNGVLDKETKLSIFNNIKSLFLYKVGGVVLTGTDNIIISTFVGVSSVGMVSNYNLLIGTIQTLTSKIFSGLTASIGNFNAQESDERKELIFDSVNFFSFWLFGFCSICFWVLCNPFIEIWIGKEYILDNSILFILILNFYIYGMQNGNWLFRDTMGLFTYSRYIPFIASVINLLVSIILATKWGIVGVFWGTAISRLLTGVWFDSYILYKHVFNKSVINYYKKYIVYFIATILTGALTMLISTKLVYTKGIIGLLQNIIICILIPNTIFYFAFNKKIEFKHLLSKVKGILHKK